MNWYSKSLFAAIRDDLADAEAVNELIDRFYQMAPEGFHIMQEDDDSWAILNPDGSKLVFDEPPDRHDTNRAESLRRAIILGLLRIGLTQRLNR